MGSGGQTEAEGSLGRGPMDPEEGPSGERISTQWGWQEFGK